MPTQFKTYFPDGTTPVNVQDMTFDRNTSTGNLNYRKDNLKLVSGNAITENFGYDNLNRLTSTQATGQPALTTSYEGNGNIDYNDLGDYVYSTTPPNAVQQIMCGSIPALPQQEISYTAFNKTFTISEGNYHLEYF